MKEQQMSDFNCYVGTIAYSEREAFQKICRYFHSDPVELVHCWSAEKDGKIMFVYSFWADSLYDEEKPDTLYKLFPHATWLPNLPIEFTVNI